MAEDEPWRSSLDDLDTEVLGAQNLAVGAFWPPIAIACALIDAGSIDRRRLLEIIDCLHSTVLARAVGGLGDPGDVGRALEKFREFFESVELKPGAVLQALQEMERYEAERLHRMKRPPPAPEHG